MLVVDFDRRYEGYEDDCMCGGSVMRVELDLVRCW